MKLAFQIAKRFLLASKKQTLVIILGIAVGVSVQVFIGALISGLQKSLVDTTIGSQSQITIVKEDDYINDYETLIATVEGASDNIKVVTPTITTRAGSLVLGEISEGVVLNGYNFTSADEIYKFSSKLTTGSEIPDAMNEVALGINLKEALGIDIGSEISFESPVFATQTFKVVGFFDFEVSAINNTWTIATIDTVQNIIGEGEVVSRIEMQLNEVFDAEEVTKLELEAVVADEYTITTWISENESLLSGLQGQSISSLMIQIFVIVSVVLGISSTLAITVLQKSKQLGILKAMGIQDGDASLIFLFEGVLLGVFGAIIGLLLGIGLLYAFTTFSGTDIPISFDAGFLALSAGIAILASTLAALSPAIKSSKLSVIEVIRNG
ncbi:MAG: ABC transporter permease [Candidatus Izemoplasmatales bacterium]|jgi:lipoprotein-releasing system permease protein|nr:ABC transporter permease [Candidatus Izemoplasmatales bacterium]